MASGLSKIVLGGLLVAGLLGIHDNFIQSYIAPNSLTFWSFTRFAPLTLALVYFFVLKHHSSPLMRALVLLPAIFTAIFVEQVSLPLEVDWLLGLPLAYQEFDLLLWISLATVLCAHQLRQSDTTNQPLDYTRRLLLLLCVLCLFGIWLLPAMGDTLLARSERWLKAWQTSTLAFDFPHQTPVIFWLETAGLSLPIILLALQTALVRNSQSRHRWACLIAVFLILVATTIRAESYPDTQSLLALSFRSSLLFLSTAILAAHIAATAWLSWHLPVPERLSQEPPSIRAELLAARMAYQEPSNSRPAYRKSVKRLVDNCHRALEREAKSRDFPSSAWINHRLQAGSKLDDPCPQSDKLKVGHAPGLYHNLARGRRLEIIVLSWLLVIATGWSEWRVDTRFLTKPPAMSTPFEASKLWKQGLKAGLLNQPDASNSAQALAKHMAPNLQQDIVWKLQKMQEVHGVQNVGAIFQTLTLCEHHDDEPPAQEGCQSHHLLEPLVLTSLDTLEQARLQHLAQLPKTWRAPQMIRDLTRRHPDLDALELSRELSSQLAALQERFMSRTGLFALILAADQEPGSIGGEAATIILNLLAPAPVLHERLQEDTRRLSARAAALYTVIFGRPVPAPAHTLSGK
ncbi:MAG: hypothetical protein HOI23_13380 [Deltaproteobacteria bacterium]|jgi:hypothetical protein|nr:hypothetical protein [Deltaproteobacteria bacterium]MBT6434485.1 hypothetical protein [Deltaproteobacteria bacterium]MBT6491610.1 hypothetical protein [Deltaproteobacteria bacterium]